jgi:hypothetical protein
MPLLDVALAVPEQRRLVVVLGELLRLPPQLVFLHWLREGHEAGAPTCLEGTAPAQRVGLVGHAPAWDGLPMQAVALVVVHLRHGGVDGNLVEVGSAEPGELRVDV